jgi:monoamine oxidase
MILKATVCASSVLVPDVLVIGAGMAGLGAARLLQDAGAKVTLIEARDRIGGRTHTSLLWPDLGVDMGASWVHGITDNPLVALADQIGAARSSAPYDRWATYDATGRRIDVSALEDTCIALIDQAREQSEDLNSDVSLRQAIEASPDWIALSPEERTAMRMIIVTRIEHEYSGDWSRLSAWSFDGDEAFNGGDILLNQGFGPIVAHLADGLDIRLSKVVTEINPLAQGVEVLTKDARHLAQHVIVTLPLGVLKAGDVRFGMGLAPTRQAAINRLEVGLLNKCWLRFDRVFWPPEPDMINFLGPETALWAEWMNGFRVTGQPLLVGFNAGRVAEAMEGLDDRETTASALRALRAIFGSAVPDPLGSQITRWRKDPFAHGAYSFVPVGASPQDRRALAGADWDGRLWFAGEATSATQSASAHGALISGRQAAAALLAAALQR